MMGAANTNIQNHRPVTLQQTCWVMLGVCEWDFELVRYD